MKNNRFYLLVMAVVFSVACVSSQNSYDANKNRSILFKCKKYKASIKYKNKTEKSVALRKACQKFQDKIKFASYPEDILAKERHEIFQILIAPVDEEKTT